MKDKQCELIVTVLNYTWYKFKVADVYQNRFLEDWADITKINKPIIAAVSGFAVCSSGISDRNV